MQRASGLCFVGREIGETSDKGLAASSAGNRSGIRAVELDGLCQDALAVGVFAKCDERFDAGAFPRRNHLRKALLLVTSHLF